MGDFTIKYIFNLSDDRQKVIDLMINKKTLLLSRKKLTQQLPQWATLEFHQCPHCLLNPNTYSYCPLMIHLVQIINRFEGDMSYEEVLVKVQTKEREFLKTTTIQKGLSSLIGIIIPTSGCPHTCFLKPMARFHLPFASEEETLYRSTSMYLLAQFFLREKKQNADVTLGGLKKIYENLKVVNISITERLRAASKTDASINAIILLDTFAWAMPYGIERSLDEIEYLFSPYLNSVQSKQK